MKKYILITSLIVPLMYSCANEDILQSDVEEVKSVEVIDNGAINY